MITFKISIRTENRIISNIRKYIDIYELEEYYECKYCGESDFYELNSQIQWNHFNIFNVCMKCSSSKISMTKNKNSLTKEFLEKEYIEKGRTLYSLKNELKCKEGTIVKYLKLYNFEETHRKENNIWL